MKKLSVAFATIGSMILIFILFFTAVEFGISDKTFINNEYTHLGLSKTMGMNNADLVASCTRLVDYMKGTVDDIDITVTINGEKTLMFDQEQEVVHMKDVRLLYSRFKNYRNVGCIAVLVLYLLSAICSFRSSLHSIAKGYILGTVVMSFGIGFIGTWAALDFSSFWTAFHQTLFWNELWLFDVNTSRMINILPQEFFKDLVLRIVLYAAVAIIILLVIAIIIVVSHNKKEAKKEEAARRAAIRRKKLAEKKAKEKAAAEKKPEEQEEQPEDNA